MTNYEIADHFSMLSRLMDIHGENSFKSKSYSIGAFFIEKLPKEIADMSEPELFSMKGIGDSLGKKILELQATGKLEALEKIIATTPPGVLEMLEIKGLGPKKIAVIWKEMGIESLGELEYACNENRLAAIKGFGSKTQQSVLENIRFYQGNQGFHLWAQVELLAKDLVDKLQKAFPDNRAVVTGEVRRQSEVVEFVEIATDIEKDILIRQFETIPDTVVEEQPDGLVVIRVPAQPALRFHLATKQGFYHTLFLSTGAPAFMEAFLNSYKIPSSPASEEEIFESSGLAFIPPFLRETGQVVQLAKEKALDEIIQPGDIKGIIHSHSTWSDGLDTIGDMAKAAIAQGLEYLVISDHSQAAYYAQGLSPERIAAQHQEIDALNANLAPFRIFKSIEADILGDGSLDYNEEILNSFDLVIASVHSNLRMSLDKAMERLLKAIANPLTTILGHPTGRLLLSREGYPVDHKRIIDACAHHGVVIEINAHPKRLDIDWRWIAYAVEKGVLLSIDPDAHSAAAFRDTYYGVMSAQKGGLKREQNLSSFSLQEFEAFLARKKPGQAISG